MPTPHHSFLQAGCPSCHPTNSVKALKALNSKTVHSTTKMEESLKEFLAFVAPENCSDFTSIHVVLEAL